MKYLFRGTATGIVSAVMMIGQVSAQNNITTDAPFDEQLVSACSTSPAECSILMSLIPPGPVQSALAQRALRATFDSPTLSEDEKTQIVQNAVGSGTDTLTDLSVVSVDALNDPALAQDGPLSAFLASTLPVAPDQVNQSPG